MKRIFDAKVWSSGHSFVITIPMRIINKFQLKPGKTVEMAIKDGK